MRGGSAAAAESGDHSHELAQGKVLPDCCVWSMCEGKAAWLSHGLVLAVAPGDVASAAVAKPDDLCGLKAGWSSATSSERPSGENENALPQNFLLRGIEPKRMQGK